MTGLLDADEAPPKKPSLRADTWHGVAKLALTLGFLTFCLWLTASKFDASEIKTLLVMAGPVAMRELWPTIRSSLKAVGDGIAAGNE